MCHSPSPHACRLRILSFLCTAALLNILHLIALEQRSRVEQFSGPICMANISQCSSRQNGLAICICHGSFPIFCPSPPARLLSLCASIAFVGIWRRFIDCAVDSSVVFGRTIFVYICPPACQAAWDAASTDATRFDSLCVVLCVVFGTFSTKHFTLFIFATIALRFQVAFEVFVLSVGAQFHQCCPCLLCCQMPLPAASVYIFRMFTSGIKLNVY